jgi:hypothetical protein
MGTSRKLAIFCLSACLLAGAAAIAQADPVLPGGPDTPTVPDDPTGDVVPSAVDPNPCPTAATAGATGCDTQYTPIAKTPGDLFKQVGGVPFGQHGVPADSFTPATVDFYAVRFLDQNNGLAGGAACKDPNTKFQDLGSCERVPVIWQYTNRRGEGPLWREVYRSDEQGFVAAVAYVNQDRRKAMAVGGTGKYPYREFSQTSDVDPDSDPAGQGRVWEVDPDRYGDGDWHEYGAAQKPTAPNIFYDPAPVDAHATGQSVSGTARPAGDAMIDTSKPLAHGGEGSIQKTETDHGLPPTDFGPVNPTIDSLPTDGVKKQHDQAYDAAGQVGKPLPTPMRALTALDCSPVEPFCVAGGNQQLFMWHKGSFDQSYGNGSPDLVAGGVEPGVLWGAGKPGDVEAAASFRFRLRSLRFVPGDHRSNGVISVVGVTAGCCDPNPANDLPRIVFYNNSNWFVSGMYAGDHLDHLRQTVADSFYGLTTDGASVSILSSAGGPELPVEPPSRLVRANIGQTAGLHASAFICAASLGLIALGPYLCSDIPNAAVTPEASDTRLVAGDGDFAAAQRTSTQISGPDTVGPQAPTPDGNMDWAVGERRSTGQAVAWTSTLVTTLPHYPSPLDCSAPTPVDTAKRQVDSSCHPTSPDNLQKRAASPNLFLLPSYRLNAFSMVGSTGIGWAVGDKGALVRMGGTGDSGVVPEPNPPRLAAPAPRPAPPAGSYKGFEGSSAGTPGVVPGLAGRMETLAEGQFVPYGAPQTQRSINVANDDVRTIVASRDGGEAWALGSGLMPASGARGRTTLFHFDGSTWTRCDIAGVGDQVPADPACSSLAPLQHYVSHHVAGSSNEQPVRITAAARVPFENDSDPANDNEFEIVATGTVYQPSSAQGEAQAVLIYRNGRWSIDEKAMADFARSDQPVATNIAFTGPDDGWITTNSSQVWHFDGSHWRNCADAPAACGEDPSAPLFPQPAQLAVSVAFEGAFRLATLGERVYLYGSGHRSTSTKSTDDYPFIFYKDPGATWKGADGDGTGLDPGCADRSSGQCAPAPNAELGAISALTVAPGPDGRLTGWASGFRRSSPGNVPSTDYTKFVEHQDGMMLHLERESDGYAWKPWTADDATVDYPSRLYYDALGGSGDPPDLVTLPGRHGADPEVLLFPGTTDTFSAGPMLRFNPAHGRWEVFSTPFRLEHSTGDTLATARGRAIAPDGQGGAWFAVRRIGGEDGFRPHSLLSSVGFYRYTDRAPRPVFTDIPHPAANMELVGAAGSPDGSFWLATTSPTVFRYDRVTGWNRMTVPGWDPGRIVIRSSPAAAIVIGPGGNGLVVGEGGRIGDLAPDSAALDPASGRSCTKGDPPPCSTGRNLTSAAISPDDESALVGGEARVVLWRPAGGQFRAVTPPPAALTATITGISMASSTRAWLTTDHGEVFAGTLKGQDWDWELENVDTNGEVLDRTLDGANGDAGEDAALRAIAIDGDGHGFAVGDFGLVLERDSDGRQPWHRVTGLPEVHYRSVTLAPGGPRRGALIGGDYGLVLSLVNGHWTVARQGDPYDGVHTSDDDWAPVVPVGLALIPGPRAGEIEAWSADQDQHNAQGFNEGRLPLTNGVFHYSSNPQDPLLNGPVEGDRAVPDSPPVEDGELRLAVFGKSDCGQPLDSTTIRCPGPTGSNLESDVIPRRTAQNLLGGQKPDLTLFTGDAVQGATQDDGSSGVVGHTHSAQDLIGRNAEWAQSGADPNRLDTGSDDLERSAAHRDWNTVVAGRFLDAGEPLLGALGPDDLSQAASVNGLFPLAKHVDSTNFGWRKAMADMPAPWGQSKAEQSANGITWVPVEDTSKKTASDESQAHTHYAVDGIREGQKLIRVVVADTSRGSLTASDPLQNPLESQSAWLDQILCIKGSQADTGSCSREADEKAVLLTDTPTYSYGPGGLTDTDNQDGAAIEALAFKDKLTAVIQGRLGWNGLYWTSTQSVHDPQPGGQYPASPPAPVNGQSPIPFVVASSAGGKFAPDAQGDSASNGYWHGYTVVRLSPDGDPAKTIVEQRPILDWLLIQGKSHVLRPGQSVHLDGVGREPVATDAPIKYDDISTPAVTHRYDLIYADPDKPWLPKGGERADACDPYDCIPTAIGTIDGQSGAVTAGSGAQERTYALALLSVGKLSTSYPISFEPRPSFRQAPAPPPLPIPPAATPPPAPAPPPPNPPFNPPTLATPPPLAPLPAQTPPAPPAPPAPPGAGPAQLDLFTSPPVLSVAPTISLFPPSPPVINVAPPTPARPVEKAKKVAVQSSGSDSDATQKSEIQQAGGDLANGPLGGDGTSGMTRHDPNAFTAVAHRDQASAWARDLQWGGGLTLMALVAAFGWITVRPTPRRRTPEVPAPAWLRRR